MDVDFLLIGQGLAGSVLSDRLLKEGKSIMILDLPENNQSSRIAAGLYNPITGRKMIKSWNADLLFPEIEPLYSSLEMAIGGKFLHKRPIYRPFLNVEEQNEWMGKSVDDDFGDYVENILTKSLYPEINDAYGGVLLKKSGFVDINLLLDQYSLFLKNIDALRVEQFKEEALQIQMEGITYKDINAKAVIYCNGLGAMKSRFFKALPFAPVKGEILDIHQDFKPHEIINRGVFRITLPNGLIRLGSTYNWNDIDLKPTESAKIELYEKLDKLMMITHKTVIHHKAGIRPATRDRIPFLGKHPEAANVYIFNGFGAKGVSLIPYYSKVMTELLIYGNRPKQDADISRFFNYI
jgi:glycine oxidase